MKQVFTWLIETRRQQPMLKKLILTLSAGLIFLLSSTSNVSATHIRAGEIIARRISNSSLEFEFSIIGYTDTGSTVKFGGGDIDFGDGTVLNVESEADPVVTINLGDEVASNVFTIRHTYQAPGVYTVRFREFYRNAGVVNMANSVETPFYTETQLIIDPFYGLNNTPVLLVPPVDRGAVGATFIHNPGAYDPDGDSLSYRISVPKRNYNDTVFDYRSPIDPKFYTKVDYATANQNQDGPPTFSLDPVSGNLVWDAPGLRGEYNVAFIVEEWRNVLGTWVKLGYVTRDMQIIIEDSENERPEVIVPEDICVEAGTLIEEDIFGIDPDGLPVILEAYGGPFEFLGSPATFSPFPPAYQPSPGTLNFTWQTVCGHVRDRPYEVQFKVVDTHPPPNAGPKLVDFKTWNITVVAPAPTGLTATIKPDKVIALEWDAYECANAEYIQIWRRVDSYDFTPIDCEVGMPDYAGYELIDVVDDGARSYTDDNKGQKLDVAANYCYRLVAVFPTPGGGVSYASAEACGILEINAPVIMNVDVKATSVEAGEIEVRWSPPIEIDQASFPPPYNYELFRAEELQGEKNIISLGVIANDTVFLDNGLNTRDVTYNYRVHLVDTQGGLIDTSGVASQVRLELKPLLQSIELTWDADVPWSNNTQDYPIHYIYRNRVDENDPGQLVQIASVDVNEEGFYFWDDGSFNGVPLNENLEYCYYVTTQGSYGNDALAEPLINSSQIICGQPNDKTPPCDPVNFVLDESFSCDAVLQSQSCDFSAFSNKLSWEKDSSDGCEDDVRSFNIYFSETGAEGSFNLIDNVITTTYRHVDLASFKGCYKISAVDRSGNESELSEAVCNDNCPYFELPNVFTPNGDGRNDVFRPFYDDGTITGFDRAKCIRFVDAVVFTVFDRAGNAIYNFTSAGVENSILIDWDGRTNEGSELPSGVYFYTADVTFDVLDPKQMNKQYKGWVQIMK